MLSGYHKLFNTERHRSIVNELKGLGVQRGFNQWWVPLVEFPAGGAVLIGLLAPLAALGLLVSSSSPSPRPDGSELNSTSRSMKRIASTIGFIYRRRFMLLCDHRFSAGAGRTALMPYPGSDEQTRRVTSHRRSHHPRMSSSPILIFFRAAGS